MSLVLSSGPAVEPLSLAEAKAFLRVDTTSEDALINGLIETSRLHIEAALDLALVTQSWSWRFDRWPSVGETALPMRPVQSIDVVNITTADGSVVTLDSALFVLDGQGVPARLVPASKTLPQPGVPALGIEVAFTAGFGDLASDVPAPIRQALQLLVAHWYEQREPTDAKGTTAPIPTMVSELLLPFRTVAL